MDLDEDGADEDSQGDEDNESGDDSEDDEDRTSEEEEESDENGSENEADNVELRRKIEEALRMNGIEAVTGHSDDDESEEELMDDEQMLALDEQLANVFKSQKKAGKGLSHSESLRCPL